ncbi:integrator complex subunit 6-like [Carlito syrichta]|uniref:Integrator complex subunit 6-like n=1 Tax=Carlito syrichta TaxID=1868482 RepID=A0A3Q0DXN0_CARSF|nr:integrator complex subunit 6-like [Carlito syrichta]
MFIEIFQEMMPDEAQKVVVVPEDKYKHSEEPKSPSFKRRKNMVLLSMKEERQGDSLLGGSIMLKEKNVPVIHDVHVEEKESGQSPTVGSPGRPVSSDLMNMVGDGFSPIPLDSQLDDITLISKDELVHKPGTDALVGEVPTSSTLSADDPKVTDMSTLPKSPEEINAGIKTQLRKEIRQFGRKYERIFALLEGVQGTQEARKQFVVSTIKEAARFKRRDLIKHLEKMLERMVPNGFSHKIE